MCSKEWKRWQEQQAEVDEKVPVPKHVPMKEVLAKGGTLRTRLIKLFDYPADTVGALRGRSDHAVWVLGWVEWWWGSA